MELNLINSVLRMVLALALICLIFVSCVYDFKEGLGIFLGGIWGGANLFFIKQLMESILTLSPKNYLKIYSLFLIKFPLIYGIGYVLIKFDYFSPWSLLIGFSLLFAALFLKGLAAWTFPSRESNN